MTKVDIFSGFLGAGKTTLIKKLIAEAYVGEQVVLIENEFGDIGVDGAFLEEAGVTLREMNSGCICCSLVGDFGEALQNVLDSYHPDRILIEPSGVGKLSDVMEAVIKLEHPDLSLNAAVTIADASKCKMYRKNFGEFYNNQIAHAGTIVLTRTGEMKGEKLEETLDILRELNTTATIVATPLAELDGKQILQAMEGSPTLARELKLLTRSVLMARRRAAGTGGGACCGGRGQGHGHHHEHEHEAGHECKCGHHHEHEHEAGHECKCGHHHEHEHEAGHECKCGHHHEHEHEAGHECKCGHEHEHEAGHECKCGHEHEHEAGHECKCGHGHHNHHHADEVFQSWGMESAQKFDKDKLQNVLEHLDDYGTVLRAKGAVPTTDGSWLHFDYVPGEISVREGNASFIGRLCVIGAGLKADTLADLFAKAH